MRILIYSIAYFPHVGGAEVAIKEITDRLPDFEFDMVTLRLDKNDARSERVGSVNVYRIDCPKFLFPFYAARKGKKLHGLREYQVVWSMMANLAGLAGLLLRSMLRNKPKFLLTLQTGNDDKKTWKRTWWWRVIYKMIYRKADYIQAISNYLAERGKRMGARCEVEVVGNGVDLSKFQISDFRFHNTSDEKRDKVVITTSRLVKKNGVGDLIKSMKDVGGNVKLLIAGIGELEAELKGLTRELGLEDRVKFLGQIKHEELPKYYAMADVFVRPSLSEGLGISFLEAMAMGLPTIATPVGGIPDFLKDGVTGWFCEPNNPESIAEKINYILDEKNKDRVEQVVENAKKMISEKYNWNNISERMGDIFRKIIL